MIVGLFNLFALLYVLRAVQLVVRVVRQWSALIKPPLSVEKKKVAEQASFFIAVPVGVFLHELGHAMAIWGVGGEVAEFGYRVFWGYVAPNGRFSSAEEWFISLTGTLGNLLFGLALWLGWRRHSSRTLRFFALRAFRFQVFFALIYYPIFTLILNIGDWRTIYNFVETPLLSGLVAPFHLGLLGLFWWGGRRGWFEMASYGSGAEEERFAGDTAVSPITASPETQLAHIDALRRGGATRKAKTRLHHFLKQHPQSALGYLQLAVLQTQEQSRISTAARDNAQKALQLDLSHPQRVAYAYQIMGRHAMERDNMQQAGEQFSNAIDKLQRAGGDAGQLAHLYYLRGRVYRRQGQYGQANADIERAIQLAEEAGQSQAVTRYQEELEVLQHHAGRRS